MTVVEPDRGEGPWIRKAPSDGLAAYVTLLKIHPILLGNQVVLRDVGLMVATGFGLDGIEPRVQRR